MTTCQIYHNIRCIIPARKELTPPIRPKMCNALRFYIHPFHSFLLSCAKLTTEHLESSNGNSNSLALRVRDRHANLLDTGLLGCNGCVTVKLHSCQLLLF